MNSIWAILFVIVATIVGKWLLFDDDEPQIDAEPPQVADPPRESTRSPLSKSA